MLISKKEENTAATQPQETAATQPQETAATQPQETAVTIKPSTEVAVGGSFWCQEQGVIDVVSTAEYGDFPQIVASQGSFSESGPTGKELGGWIAFTPILAKEKKVCAPGSQDDEAKEFFAAAYVGECLPDGRTIEDAVSDAKAAGYDKAAVKDYTDLFVKVISHEKGDGFMDNEIVSLQLSPMSRIEWRKFSKRLQAKAAYGELNADGVAVKAVAKKAKTKSGKEYTNYTFELA